MMDIEVHDENQGGTPVSRENGFMLMPVSPEETGEGLPYAPENWPNPGDTWGWRVGKRVSQAGHFLDRYLYLPKHLPRNEASGGKGAFAFASKLSIERYIQTTFPGADVNAFFASFSWKIPAKGRSLTNGNNLIALSAEERLEQSLCDSSSDNGGCKAGNKMCSSLVEQVENSPLSIMVCDICCSEPRFCRDCCCILCCKTVNYTYGSYSYIRCEAVAEEGRMCGHIAHISCALRSYMAGKVGGSIGLDVEYYCRRCDVKSDLVPHVTRLLQTCKSIDTRDDIVKILKVGLSILRGSERTSAKRLLNRIELAISKLNCGTSLEDIWKVEDNFLALTPDIAGHDIAAMEVVNHLEPMDNPTDSPNVPVSFDWQTESQKLEEEVDHVLQALRKSQEMEYKVAEERLYSQKDYLASLYQQLDSERSELTRHITSTNQDNLLSAILNRVDQIKRELVKFKDMKKVASGFGKTSRGILEEHFDLELEG
ncbi:hypothetical protein TIFTF001_015875 [Ficus carica]|uniref:Oberon PHD finger domain-containing protein n=1 Tax=Ficus carica TaxID=3494 RepID=A0AA88AIJ7_FICCA|nr:hypothetical protein TIFTF001_015875 [Ficus carica]